MVGIKRPWRTVENGWKNEIFYWTIAFTLPIGSLSSNASSRASLVHAYSCAIYGRKPVYTFYNGGRVVRVECRFLWYVLAWEPNPHRYRDEPTSNRRPSRLACESMDDAFAITFSPHLTSSIQTRKKKLHVVRTYALSYFESHKSISTLLQCLHVGFTFLISYFIFFVIL